MYNGFHKENVSCGLLRSFTHFVSCPISFMVCFAAFQTTYILYTYTYSHENSSLYRINLMKIVFVVGLCNFKFVLHMRDDVILIVPTYNMKNIINSIHNHAASIVCPKKLMGNGQWYRRADVKIFCFPHSNVTSPSIAHYFLLWHVLTVVGLNFRYKLLNLQCHPSIMYMAGYVCVIGLWLCNSRERV